jgi:hypothetical protein
MKLLVHELVGSLSQDMTTPSEVVQIEAVRPHIYKHNEPAGNVKVQITDLSDELIAESDTLTIADISDESFFHGYVTFSVNAQLRPDTTYRFKVVAGGGYLFSESAYVGVCNGFDLAKYPMDYTPSIGANSALDLEIWRRE